MAAMTHGDSRSPAYLYPAATPFLYYRKLEKIPTKLRFVFKILLAGRTLLPKRHLYRRPRQFSIVTTATSRSYPIPLPSETRKDSVASWLKFFVLESRIFQSVILVNFPRIIETFDPRVLPNETRQSTASTDRCFTFHRERTP